MRKQHIDAKVRPLDNQKVHWAGRISVARDALLSLTGSLEQGRLCVVERLDDGALNEDSSTPAPVRREASLYTPEKNISPNVVQMTRGFQEAAGLRLGDQVRISLSGGLVPDAAQVVLQEIPQDDARDKSWWAEFAPPWEFILRDYLDVADSMFPGMVLEGVSLGRTRKKFKVVSIDGKGSNCARFDPKTTVVRLLPPGSEDFSAPDSAGKLFVENVPGLAPQVAELNEFLDRFEYSAGLVGEFRSCGIVVHGSHGTGKSLLLHRIADTRWGKVHKIKPTDKLTAIREAFKLARAQPSMILFDDFQKLVTQDRSNSSSVIAAIAEELGSLAEEARSTGVLPRVLVVATCLDFVNDMPWELQGHSAFYKNIVLPIPRVAGRLEILKYLDPAMKAEEYESCLADTAEKTHAYNGGDLKTLVYEAMDANRRRLKREGVDLRTIEQRYISPEDMKEALSKTTPTTMHDVNLSPPTIHWQDVGGQEGVKKTLSRMIKHTKQNPTPSANKFMQRPPKGLILYGPPGCSKTLSAQAMATESGFNFFAVKGAELLNMYVGESERAVRALFARARAASPSIIFFDEIDSISGQRSGSATASKASVSSVNMLTTLLTEMDGFEALQGVLVLAATNRPEAMDSALLRPGRFDRVLYVGPPDREAREAVFKVHLKGLTVGELDYGELAVKSEGHSGAEIQSICANAGEVVQERADEDEEGKRHEIGQADLLQALEREPRQITQQMLDGYERWSNRFKKTM